MAGSEDKKKTQENKYAHDSEMQFKAHARRNKLLGLWAAGKMGQSADEAENYAKNLVVEGLREAGDVRLVSKLAVDFTENGLEITEADIRTQIQELMVKAQEQILSET